MSLLNGLLGHSWSAASALGQGNSVVVVESNSGGPKVSRLESRALVWLDERGAH